MEVPMNRLPIRTTRILGLLAPALLAAAAVAPKAQAADPVLRMRALAVNMSATSAASRTNTVEIVIERWSTDEEVKMLLDTMVERTPEKLLDAVQKIKPRVGYIRTTGSLGWDIKVARQQDLPDGGMKVVFGTDRPMSFYEQATNQRSADYEYMVGEIRLRADGKGEGKLATAAKVRFDRAIQTFEIEDYSTEPVRLSEVVVEGRAEAKR
jgi:hypothetical protein